jgi:hypothetical protein
MSKAETVKQYLKFSISPALAIGTVLAEQAGQTPIVIVAGGLTILTISHLVKHEPTFGGFQAGRKLGEQRGFRIGYSKRILDEADQLAKQEETLKR